MLRKEKKNATLSFEKYALAEFLLAMFIYKYSI